MEKIQMVETGAHGGQLAADILGWFRKWRPDLFDRMEYWLVEPSRTRRRWQEEALAAFSSKVKWTEGLEFFGEPGVNGIIFSNELLDALPAHRLRWSCEKRKWEEWRVGWNGIAFDWQVSALPADLRAFAPSVPETLAAVLPDGFATEISPQAIAGWRAAARALRRGVLLTVDYGLNAEDFLMPERSKGTLRAYHRHRVNDKLLENAGQQDITASVNFTAIRRAGEMEGLQTRFFVSQAKFLTRVLEETLKEPARFESWTPERVRQFQTLTHPEHLGRAFRVLAQERFNVDKQDIQDEAFAKVIESTC